MITPSRVVKTCDHVEFESRLLNPSSNSEPPLPEPQIRVVHRAVLQDHDQLTARTAPRVLGLPDVVVLIGLRIVREPARARVVGRLDNLNRLRRIAGNLT